MTDQKSDSDNHEPALAASSAPLVAPVVVPPPRSGRGLAALALLTGLGAAGASAYLGYLWQQDQLTRSARLDAAIKQSLAQREPELQAIKNQIKQLQALQADITQTQAANQALREQLLGVTGDLQPLKNALELNKGETGILKGEMKLLQEGQEAHKGSIRQQQEELGKQLQQQQAGSVALGTQIENLKLAQAGLNAELETVKTLAAKGADINAFPLAEVDYLLRLADTKLKLERNVAAARLALEAAVQRLKTVNESGLGPIQTQLNEAVASLRGVQLPDLTALDHKIMAMEKPVASLALKVDSGIADIRERIKPATTVNLSTEPDRSWWERSSEAVWNQFKDIVVIRRQRLEAPPLIARENEFFLRQNLRLELEGLRMALLHSDAEAYQDAWQRVIDWTQSYFEVTDPKVATFLAELRALQSIQFNPYIPDLAGVRQAFQEFMTRRQPVRALRSAPAAEPAATGEAPQ